MSEWRVNMDNGDTFIVKSEINKVEDFIKLILGDNPNRLNITSFPLAINNMFNDGKTEYKSNAVIIPSNKVSSIEFLTQ